MLNCISQKENANQNKKVLYNTLPGRATIAKTTSKPSEVASLSNTVHNKNVYKLEWESKPTIILENSLGETTKAEYMLSNSNLKIQNMEFFKNRKCLNTNTCFKQKMPSMDSCDRFSQNTGARALKITCKFTFRLCV